MKRVALFWAIPVMASGSAYAQDVDRRTASLVEALCQGSEKHRVEARVALEDFGLRALKALAAAAPREASAREVMERIAYKPIRATIEDQDWFDGAGDDPPTVKWIDHPSLRDVFPSCSYFVWEDQNSKPDIICVVGFDEETSIFFPVHEDRPMAMVRRARAAKDRKDDALKIAAVLAGLFVRPRCDTFTPVPKDRLLVDGDDSLLIDGSWKGGRWSFSVGDAGRFTTAEFKWRGSLH